MLGRVWLSTISDLCCRFKATAQLSARLRFCRVQYGRVFTHPTTCLFGLPFSRSAVWPPTAGRLAEGLVLPAIVMVV